jgi:hypothetical protein
MLFVSSGGKPQSQLSPTPNYPEFGDDVTFFSSLLSNACGRGFPTSGSALLVPVTRKKLRDVIDLQKGDRSLRLTV